MHPKALARARTYVNDCIIRSTLVQTELVSMAPTILTDAIKDLSTTFAGYQGNLWAILCKSVFF